MKITFCVLGILCFAGMAFGQAGSATSSGISAEPIVYEFQSHSARAAQQGMGQAQDIILAADHAAQTVLQLHRAAGSCNQGFGSH